jgi:hypothetical protein
LDRLKQALGGQASNARDLFLSSGCPVQQQSDRRCGIAFHLHRQ